MKVYLVNKHCMYGNNFEKFAYLNKDMAQLKIEELNRIDSGGTDVSPWQIEEVVIEDGIGKIGDN
jgi:hypothetical protein